MSDEELIADAKRWGGKKSGKFCRVTPFKSKITGFWMAQFIGPTRLYKVVYDTCDGHRTERELWLALGKLLRLLRKDLA